MDDSEYIGYYIESDVNHHLLYLQIAGCVLSYIAIIYNIIILVVLSRPGVRSPTTVLMQGLAIADLLTGFCSYGLEPLFQVKYITASVSLDSMRLTLMYPLCALYVHIGQLVDMFHLVSVLLTTCLGIQKVLALKFPYWMRNNFKMKFALVCCVLCFMMSLCIDFPRHLSVSFANRENVSYGYFDGGLYKEKVLPDACVPSRESRNAFMYATRYYPLVQAVLLVVLSAVMCLCVVYIVYRLCHRTFRKKSIVHRTRERRSVMMITAVLVIFLISEIPRLSIYGCLFFGPYLQQMYTTETDDDYLAWVMTDYRSTLAINLKIESDLSFSQLLLIIESLKVISLIGCMSNFVIYFTMSQQLRNELKVCLPFKR